MEKEDVEKGNGLAGLVGGIVISAAALLPISGCTESYVGVGYYGSRHGSGYYNPNYISPSIIVPIYPRQHYGGRDRDFHRLPQRHQQFNAPPRYSPRPPQNFNNRPNRNPSNNQRDHRR